MKPKKSRKEKQANFLYPDLMEQLNPKHPLLELGKKIPWGKFENVFIKIYSDQG